MEEKKIKDIISEAIERAFKPFEDRIEAVERKIHEKRVQTQQTAMKRMMKESLNPMVN